MRLIILYSLIFISSFSYAKEIIKHGTYLGKNSLILNIDSGPKDDSPLIGYDLFLLGSEKYEDIRISASTIKRIESGDKKLFTYSNRYDGWRDDEGDVSPVTSCFFHVDFLSSEKIYITADNSCSDNEKSFDGEYTYSEKINSIPKKYWGEWGTQEECKHEDHAYIHETNTTPDGYYFFGILGWESNHNNITVDGLSWDEGNVIRKKIHYTLLPNGNLAWSFDQEDLEENETNNTDNTGIPSCISYLQNKKDSSKTRTITTKASVMSFTKLNLSTTNKGDTHKNSSNPRKVSQTQRSTNNSYYLSNYYGYGSKPSALCADGTYSYSLSRRGVCSRHGGVKRWF